MSRPAFLALLLLSAWSIPMMGCEDEPPPPPRAAPKKTTKAAGAKAGAINEANLPAKLRNVDWSKEDKATRPDRKTRDPFLPIVDDLITKMIEDKQNADDANKPSAAERRRVSAFNVEELQLIAIVTGTAVHHAMVTDPSGLGHMIQTGDVVGRDVPYRVTRITRNEAIFKPLQPPTDENQPKEIRKALRSNDELEELLP